MIEFKKLLLRATRPRQAILAFACLLSCMTAPQLSGETKLRTGATWFTSDERLQEFEYWGELLGSQAWFLTQRRALFLDASGRVLHRSEDDALGFLGSAELEHSYRWTAGGQNGLAGLGIGGVLDADTQDSDTFGEIFTFGYLSLDQDRLTAFLQPEISFRSYDEQSLAAELETGLSASLGESAVLRPSLTGKLRRYENDDREQRLEAATEVTWYRSANTVFRAEAWLARNQSNRRYEVEALTNDGEEEALALDDYYEFAIEPSGTFGLGTRTRLVLEFLLRYRHKDHNAVGNAGLTETREWELLAEPRARVRHRITDSLYLEPSVRFGSYRSNSDHLEHNRGIFEAFLEWRF